MKKICPNCGAETEGNFCPDCGTNLTNNIGQDDLQVEVEPVEQDESTPGLVDYEETTSVNVSNAVENDAFDSKDPMPSKESAAQIPKQKKLPKKLIGIIAAVAVLAVAGVVGYMYIGTGSNIISKAYEEGTTEQTIGALTYMVPSSWKEDDTYKNPDEFYETQRYFIKNDDGSDAVDCYVQYCGESKYYGNSLADYENKASSDEVVSEESLSLTGAEGKHICKSFTDVNGDNNYVDLYLVEADGSIFSFEFDTNDNSHDQKGMNSIVSGAQFGSYESPVKESIVGKGKYTDSANAIMRELICTIRKNNDTENLGCGEFTYEEASTKGGALCYSIKENGYETGVALSFYTDKKREHPIDSFDDIPTSVAVATSMSSFLDYKDTSISLINGTFVQITGDVKYSQGYSKYVNGVEESTGISSLDWYTNSFTLNDFDYELSVNTKTGEYAVFMNVQ